LNELDDLIQVIRQSVAFKNYPADLITSRLWD